MAPHTSLERRPQAERRAQARSELIEAARDTVAELGYSAATTTEIQRRAGRAAGGLYHYWPSKAELMAEVLRHSLESYFQALADAATAVPINGRGRADAVFDVLWAYQAREPTVIADISMAARSDPKLATAIAGTVDAATPQLTTAMAMLTETFGTSITEHALSTMSLAITGTMLTVDRANDTVLRAHEAQLRLAWHKLLS